MFATQATAPRPAARRRVRLTRADRLFNIVVYTFLGLAALSVAYPLYFIILASISDPVAINSGQTLLLPKGVNLNTYQAILEENRIWIGYRNTILYTFFGTLLSLACKIPAGYALSRSDLPGAGIIMKLLVFTMYFTGGLIPTYMVVQGLGLVNNPLVMVILGCVSVYDIIIARTYFRANIPREMLEAAYLDGCGNLRFFFSIVIPLSGAIIAVIALYSAVGYWNGFFNALIYLSKQEYFPLQLVVRDLLLVSQTIANSGEGDPYAVQNALRLAETMKYGIIIVCSLPMLVLYPFIQRFFVKGVMIGGIKG